MNAWVNGDSVGERTTYGKKRILTNLFNMNCEIKNFDNGYQARILNFFVLSSNWESQRYDYNYLTYLKPTSWDDQMASESNGISWEN